jgi:hypothetical protein
MPNSQHSLQPTSNMTKGKQGGPGKKRPGVWKCGPDEYKHSMYQPWLLSKAQANFRGEKWELEFEEYYELWRENWHARGRGADDYCMTRIDYDDPWNTTNAIIVLRKEHLAKQGSYRQKQLRIKRKKL